MSRRLDLALIRRHPELSRRRARDVIEKGQVHVDGATVLEPGRSIPSDADVSWDPNRKARPRARLALPRLYEDADLLVVDKPAGLLTVPTPEGGEDSALAQVQDYVRHLTPRRPYLGRVHRIDRDTSGAVVFALTPDARRGLIQLFREHRMERVYEALVHGTPRESEGDIALPISDSYRAGRRHVGRPGEAARDAVTRFRVVETLRGASRIELRPLTGRQHQIRIHLAAIGHPVLGDAVYRSAVAPGVLRPARHLLHARVLAFPHPSDGRPVRVESPLPADFLEALARLRRGAPRH